MFGFFDSPFAIGFDGMPIIPEPDRPDYEAEYYNCQGQRILRERDMMDMLRQELRRHDV